MNKNTALNPSNDFKPVADLIKQYKELIKESKLVDEVYKWQLVNEYNGRPDTNATDFQKEIKSINFSNLLYAMSIAVINHLAIEKPEELRELFKYLFDESIPLSKRITFFDKETLKLYRAMGEKLSHHQDERSIATYLTYHNSDKYTFYKSSFYQKYCKLIGIKAKKKGEKYLHYLQLIEQFIDDYIKDDIELINLVKETIPEYYDGSNHLLLAQDILYEMLDRKTDEINYWVFQANPKYYRVVDALEAGALNSWTVTAHKDKISIGDKVILWVTGDHPGCYALCKVTSAIESKLDDEIEQQYYTDQSSNKVHDRVQIEIEHNLWNTPVLKDSISNQPAFHDFKGGNQGTNFTATKEQYNEVLYIFSGNNSFRDIFTKFEQEDINEYFTFLNEIIQLFNLKKGDGRIVFSVRSNGLRFTVGQRYCLSLSINDPKGKFGVISKDKLLESSEPFSGNLPHPYYNYYNKLDLKAEEKKSVLDAISIELKRTNKSSFRKHNNADFENYIYHTVQESTPRNMNFPLNQILYGPPGTGKTYNTVLRAAEIIENRKIDDYDEAKKIFKENLHNRIEFITFHQNYSYEDFIQGLRPDTDNGEQLTFERKDGVFKMISDKALENLKLSKKEPTEQSKEVLFDDALEKFTETLQELEEDFHIPDSVAYITAITDKAFRYKGENWGNSQLMKFKDLKELYLQNAKNRKEVKKLTNISGLAKQHASYFLRVYNEVIKFLPEQQTLPEKIQQVNYVIIIDEINRANISRVFGELITLIEPDKRSHGEIPLEARLPSGDSFIVPSNLFIIGTMNTADKSIALLDIALRRRFDFESMYPKYEINGHEIYDKEILRKINEQIIKSKGHDFQIGHSYFMGVNNDLVTRMNKKVIPLLLEYYMNDEKEIKGILTNAGLELEEDSWPLRIIGKRD